MEFLKKANKKPSNQIFKMNKCLLEATVTFDNVVGYKINTQTQSASCYQWQNIRKMIQGYKPIYISLDEKTHIGINLIKDAKDHYKENSKTMKEEIEEHTRRWNNFTLSWIGRINILKMAILLTEI